MTIIIIINRGLTTEPHAHYNLTYILIFRFVQLGNVDIVKQTCYNITLSAYCIILYIIIIRITKIIIIKKNFIV